MPTGTEHADVVVIGAGIVGLATARALLADRPGLHVVVLDKEDHVAAHQTGHNSGVVHSGIYYRPGSLKATLVASGRAELLRLCRERGLHLDVRGKVVVAASERELTRLADLESRAAAHGIPTEWLDPAGLRAREPHVTGLGALLVPSAAIVDFVEVAHAFADDVRAGGEVHLSTSVEALRVEPAGGGVTVETRGCTWRATAVVNCAGLHADVLAHATGADTTTRIVPFRGEYHELVPARRHLIRGLVYPVPDPRFPFLGAHFTPMVDGGVHVGPNAVLALAREGYGWTDVDPAELWAMARTPGLRHMARRHWRTGSGEVVRSFSTRAMVRRLRSLVPDLEPADLVRVGAGVRAQAVAPDGSLLDDFVIERSGPVVHVLNAPSPAATASPAIGRHIARLVLDGIPT